MATFEADAAKMSSTEVVEQWRGKHALLVEELEVKSKQLAKVGCGPSLWNSGRSGCRDSHAFLGCGLDDCPCGETRVRECSPGVSSRPRRLQSCNNQGLCGSLVRRRRLFLDSTMISQLAS